jgi:hypothetical protein
VRAVARDEDGNWCHGNDELLINVVDHAEVVPVKRARASRKKPPRSRGLKE